MNTPTREQIVESLHHGVCEVSFVKKDGTQRQMKCTLHHSFMPPRKEGLSEETKPNQGNAIIVWDVDANAFRSFNLETVSNFNPSFRILNG